MQQKNIGSYFVAFLLLFFVVDFHFRVGVVAYFFIFFGGWD
jgi:hypothetical protein